MVEIEPHILSFIRWYTYTFVESLDFLLSHEFKM